MPPSAPPRAPFDPFELATALSHYDLGVIEQARLFPRGSRRAPKVRISCERGEFLLKRRAPGRDDPYRVAFAHSIQLALADRGYPVPRLIGTRRDDNSMLQLHGRVYELFQFVEGTRYDRTPQATFAAGEALAVLHRLLAGFRPEYNPPTGTFHGLPEASVTCRQCVDSIAAHEAKVDRAALAATAEMLRQAYEDAAARAEAAGIASMERSIIHGDWHPGNLVYRAGRIVAVLDFDSARLEPPLADVANAMLQFSMRMARPDDPRGWPEGFDVQRMVHLLKGYNRASERPLAPAALAAAPWLIMEALIVESIVPIAATGTFARIPGSAFLAMVERKIAWLRPRAARLAEVLAEQGS
jgi:homoserine kinase type II